MARTTVPRPLWRQKGVPLLFLAAVGVLLSACSATPPQPQGSDAVAVALAMRGVPYRYGGETPAGFDCSGLVYYSYAQAGVALPRDSRSQLALTRTVARAALAPGDLVFFRTEGGKTLHVGLYVGHDRFVHAPSRRGRVALAELTDSYWRRHFVRGGRVP